MRYVVTLAITLFCLPISAASGCTSGESDDSSSGGFCAPTCPEVCDTDADCDLSSGEMCCDYGSDGKACAPAAECPNLCERDSDCKGTSGEACRRTLLSTTERECTSELGYTPCAGDGDCATDLGEKCCTAYRAPLCLPSSHCPSSCKTNKDCDTESGEICCTSLPEVDPALGVPGICVDPDRLACPSMCNTSSDCAASDGEICCNGICSTSCETSCRSSDDCQGEVCCKTRAARSPFRTRLDPSYDASGASSLSDDSVSPSYAALCEDFCAFGASLGCPDADTECMSACTSEPAIACEDESRAYMRCMMDYGFDCTTTPEECVDVHDTVDNCTAP